MQPFELTIQVRNNWLKGRRRKLKMSQADLSKETGVPIIWISAFETMKADYLTSQAGMDYAVKLGNFFEVSIDKLFPPERELIKQSKAVRLLSADQVKRLASVASRALLPEPTQTPEQAVEKIELRDHVREVLTTLTPRQQNVLKMRFGIESGNPKTLGEIGKDFQVTRERIQEIEAKALRDLRNPKRSGKLKAFFVRGGQEALKKAKHNLTGGCHVVVREMGAVVALGLAQKEANPA